MLRGGFPTDKHRTDRLTQLLEILAVADGASPAGECNGVSWRVTLSTSGEALPARRDYIG